MAYDSASMMGRTKVHKRCSQLETLRSPWLSNWQDVADHIDPQSVRVSALEARDGQKSRANIIDNKPVLAQQTLQAGLMSGMTSPARPWIRLTIEDTELAEFEPVKEWLSNETRKMLSIFHKSRTYLTLHMIYGQLGIAGCGCAIMMDSYDDVIGQYVSPLGEFSFAGDFHGRVDTVSRKFSKSVSELVSEFGLKNVSQNVRNMYDSGSYDTLVPVYHLISPRRERDVTRRDNKNMPFSSCYVEASADNSEQYLRESGYEDFPGLCPRWDRRPGDIYGTSPGWYALGDIKQLQHQQMHKGRAIEYMVQPPLQAPSYFEDTPQDMLPGGVNYTDMVDQNSSIRSIWDVRMDINALREDIFDVRRRIDEAFFVDVFRMFNSYGTDTQMTATEVAERHEEKMLMLGPVLERLHDELLKPLVDMTFARMVETGITEPAPPELEGQDLDVEFTSVLAQAQRAIRVNGVDRFVVNLGQVATMKPEVLDKIDADAWADLYGDSLGVDPRIIVGNEQVALIRESRAERQRQEEALASAQAQAETAAKLGTVSTPDGNLATDLLNSLQGYGSPSGIDA